MCCIAACRTTRLSRAMLDAMVSSNQDGVGMAWTDGKKVRWFKTMNHEQLYDMIEKLPLPYIVHARLATVGAAGPALAHPFPIESQPRITEAGKAEQVFAHNGHIAEWRMLLHLTDPKVKPEESGWSDSRAIAHIVSLRGTKILDYLSGNRFAVLSSDGIITWGSWYTIDDVQYSSYPTTYRTQWHGFDHFESWRWPDDPTETRIAIEKEREKERIAKNRQAYDAYDRYKAAKEAKRLARALDYTERHNSDK